MSKGNGIRHILIGFVGGKTEHHALVAGSCVKIVLKLTCLGFKRLINAHCDVCRLLIYSNEHSTGIAVKSILRLGITYLLNGIPYDLLHINICVGGDLTGYEHETSAACSLTRNTAHGILLHASVQDRIRDRIAYFVGMSFRYGF